MLNAVIRVLALIFIFSLCSQSFACEKNISVSVASGWPPYSFKTKNGFEGVDIEILNTVFKKAGYCLTYVVFPSSARGFAELKKGMVDVIFAASWTLERQNIGHFSAPYRKEYLSSFTSANNDVQFQYNKNKAIAVNRGSFLGQKFSMYKNECSHCVFEVSNTNQRLSLLKSKRVDYAIEDLFSGLYLMQTPEFKGYIKLDNEAFHVNHVHYLLNKKAFSLDSVKQLNKVINDSDEEISQLLIKHRRLLTQKAGL